MTEGKLFHSPGMEKPATSEAEPQGEVHPPHHRGANSDEEMNE